MRHRNLDVRVIGQQLGVAAVLEGSVRRAGSRIRLSARLVSTTDGYQLWSETYDRQLADIFDVQDELARAIVNALRPGYVGPPDVRLVEPPTDDLEAYQLYLKGRFFSNRRTPDGLRKGIEHFEQTVMADPGYALAHSGLADSYSMMAVYCVLPPSEAYPKAKAAARRALELDDGLAEAHLSTAYVALIYEWDWAEAERACWRAIALNPSYAQAYHWLGWSLASVGRLDEAATAARRAMVLEPLSPIIQSRAAQIVSYAGMPEEGVAGSRRALELDSDFYLAYETMASAYIHPRLRKYDEALAAIGRMPALPSTSRRFLEPLVYALRGDREEATRRLAQLDVDPSAERVPPGYLTMQLAQTCAVLGNMDEAFRWLRRARDERLHTIALLKADPEFERLRPDPRFGELLRSVGLE
jgi:tetratricopeptide (TPR) repeat protein